MVKIKKMGELGHEEITVSTEEALEMIAAEEGRYFVVDAATNKILKEIKLGENQTLLLIPIIGAG